MKQYSNPTPTVDMILQKGSDILLIRRKKDPFKGQLALPGGFINEGEKAEEAAKREVFEETALDVEPIEIIGVYSDPRRDPRKHILTVVFVGTIIGGQLKPGDDSEGVEWVNIDKIDKVQLAFDHRQILHDYRYWRSAGGTFWSSKKRPY